MSRGSVAWALGFRPNCVIRCVSLTSTRRAALDLGLTVVIEPGRYAIERELGERGMAM